MGKRKVLLVIFLVLLGFFVTFYLLFRFIILPQFDYKKIKSSNGITSILVLGKGGEGHTAPDLTDTMMVVYLNQYSKKINILSLPRDIWVPAIRAKLNSAYYWGKQKSETNFELVETSVSGITNIPVSYTAVIDFSMFKDLVNVLGGINVEVDNSFIDNKFPILGKEEDLCDGDKTYACRYKTVSFDKGITKMDGETALEFIRSRNAEGDEGTDLARGLRQQKVISAIKEKLLSKEILSNPIKIKEIYDITFSYVETNIDEDSLLVLGKLILESGNDINFISILEEFLEVAQNSSRYDYQYVFIPKSGNWSKLHTWIQSIILK